MLPLPLREEPSTRSEVDGKTIATLSYMEIYNDKATSTAASGLHCQHTSDFVLCRFDCRLLLAPCCACHCGPQHSERSARQALASFPGQGPIAS